MSEEFTVGVDIGQSQDPTAICVLRKVDFGGARPTFEVGHLSRLPLGTIYPNVVSHVAGLMSRLRAPAELVLDVTGCGRPVGDMFAVAGLSPIGVTITAGDAVTSEGLNFHVGKIALVSRLQACLHNHQLRIYDGLADAQALIEELQNFRAQVSDSGYWKFGARANKHDDLVLSVALALWRSHGDTCFSGWGVFEHYRKEFGDGAVDREPTALPAPPVEPADVVLKPLMANISSASGLSGRNYLPDRNGNFTMTVEDAKVMIGHGWQRVPA